MNKRLFSFILMAVLVMSLCLTACSKPSETTEANAEDIEKAAADYLVTEMGKNYDKADAVIPWLYLVGTEVGSDDSVTVYGDFWVETYNVKGETLENEAGGNYPGVMHMEKDGDTYKVVKFDQVEDGSNYDSSARKLFGSYYDAFAKFQSDDDAKTDVRTKAIANYVKANGLKVTQYQDYGWDPVSLPAE